MKELIFLIEDDPSVRSVKKTCVHIVHPDGRIIPFDTFNMFYRDQKETRLKELRGEGNLVPLMVAGAMNHR